jgi:hypothetical protein
MDPAGHGSAVRRPKPGEDEDDLLRQMHNFKSEQSSISKENVVRMGEKRKSDEAGEPDEEAVRAGSVMSRNIVERNIAAVVEGEMLRPKRNPAGEEIAFPKVFNAREGAKLDDGEGVGGKKRSLFAQVNEEACDITRKRPFGNIKIIFCSEWLLKAVQTRRQQRVPKESKCANTRRIGARTAEFYRGPVSRT